MGERVPRTQAAVVGVGPDAKHRFFASSGRFSRVRRLRSVLEAEGVICDALILRNRALYLTP